MNMCKVLFAVVLCGCVFLLHAQSIQAGVPANPSVLNIQRTMKMLEESTAERPATVRVLFYGQSITAQGWTNILMDNLTNRYPTVNFVWENRAIGGYESPSLIRTAESDLYPFYPDILFFHVYGPLDKYEEIIRRVRERTTAEIVLWTSHLSRKQDPVEMLRSRDERSRRILEIAEKYGCLAVDLNRKWSEMMIGCGYTMDDLLIDGIHMKDKGPAWPAYAAFVGGELVRVPGTEGNPKFSGTVTKVNLDDSLVKRGEDGSITLSFTGNRVVAVSDGTSSEGATAKLLLDGRPVDAYPEMYANTRPSSLVNWMPMIKLVTRTDTAMPVAEEWTLTYIDGTQNDGQKIHYRLDGSVTGFDGEGWNTERFVSRSGRAVIAPDDFHVWQYEYAKDKKYYIDKGVDKAKVGDKVEWRTVKMFADPYEASPVGTQTVLVQNCANGPHTLTIIPQSGSVGIGAFIVNAPAASYSKSDVIGKFDPRMAVGKSVVDTNGVKWVDGRYLPLEGKCFSDVELFYDRMPSNVTERVNSGVSYMKHFSPGMQFRFRTDSRSLIFKWVPFASDLAMDNMPSTGVSGIDVYRQDADGKWEYIRTGRVKEARGAELRIPWRPGDACLVNLPLYNGIRSFSLGVDEHAKVEALGPRKSGIDKPVVFYGTSITQGGCASRPGMSFVNIVGRDLDVPVANLGFSGCGRMELEMSEHLARIDASCYVLDCLWNMHRPNPDPKAAYQDIYDAGYDESDQMPVVRLRYEPFIRALRSKRPDVPIVMVEQCDVFCGRQSEKDKFVRAIYDKLVAEGWKNLVYLPKDKMYCGDREGTVDSCHPNDYGMMFMAKAFGEAVREALSIKTTAFSISDFGAKPDGSKCTEAFAAAFAAAEKAGGGRVVVPRGKWFTGAIRFKSNCELHLEDGAEVLFSQDPEDYLPAVFTSWEGMECWNYCPLVYAYGCTNVAITGNGTLRAYEGRWEDTKWHPWVPQENGIKAARLQLYTWGATDYPVEKREIWKMPNAHTRPHFIQFNRCRNVRLEDFKVRNSPFWTIHLYQCEDATARGLDVYAHGNNNDGIDIEMSKNVLVEKCVFDQGDDGVVIKSGRNRDAWRIGKPTENVLVRDCEIRNAHTVLGIGSEISGGVRNVRMKDCTAGDVNRVFYLKTNRRRGGFLEDITCENVTARSAKTSVFEIATDILYEWADFPDYENRTTRISGITARNIAVDSTKDVVKLCGDPSLPPQDIRWENVTAKKFSGKELDVVKIDIVDRADSTPDGVFRHGDVVLFIGDSITDGGRRGDMNHYLGHGYQAEIAMRYLAYRPEWRIQFANRGISGDTSAKLVSRWGRDAMPFTANATGESGVFGWSERTKEFLPDVISILVGINDYRLKGDRHVSAQDYERNLRFMVTNSVAANPSVRIVLCEPFSLRGETEPGFLSRQAIVRKVAEDYNLAFVPFQKLFSERLLKMCPNRRYWFWDAFHPTYAAHMHMADFWLETVAAEFAAGKGVADPDVVKCRQWLAERWRENDANGNPVVERGAPFPIDMPLPWLEKDNYDWFERHQSRVELARTTNPQIVFIGDSITHGWEANDRRGNAKGVFNHWFGKYSTLNLGFGWDRIQNVLWRLEHGEMDGTNPKVVVVHIGTNNTAPGYKYNAAPNPPGEIADGILVVCKKVRELAPKARIVLMKVFPRGKTPADPYRGKVAAVNAELDRRLASFHDDRLTVIDMHDKFVDAEGNISLDLTIDYLHPTAKGYDLWAAALAPIIEKECGAAVQKITQSKQ